MYALGGDSIRSNQSSMAAVTIKNEDTGIINFVTTSIASVHYYIWVLFSKQTVFF